ncbi:MAG: efflux RND transporter periplasmic adaptor subunit [Thioalkalivibrio sp.]|nr:efflux RND transporter periplasmic adaptor subunit [Thioalkalivibrio sp.]
MRKLVVWFMGALIALPATGCGSRHDDSGGPTAKPAAPVQVERATVRDLTRSVVYTGSIEPVRVARMASPAEGPIVECVVREGDTVRVDQRLVVLGRSHMAESGLEAARAELVRQAEDLARVEQLVKSGSLPAEQLEIGRAAVKRAEAQVAAGETGAADYEIRAPWEGVVSRVWISEGNYVAPRAPLVEIYDPGSLRARFAVPEQEVRHLKVGTSVAIHLDAWPDARLTGAIERIYPQLEPTTRTVTVEAGLAADVPLLSGMFARVEVPVQTAPGAVVIPASALLSLPDGGLVVFLAKADKAVRLPVEIGLEAGGSVQILAGVAAGEDVIVRGQENLKDGAAIRIMGAKPDPPAAGQGPSAPEEKKAGR